MKHGKGTELPGMPPSQGARIGVIYVSPHDDRRTILTAILAEERLKREKIVLDLPQENTAFQRLKDFDDLKLHRNKLQAELIFVIPSGLGPAKFARRHGFAVFSRMDSFVHSITAESANQPPRSAPALPTPPPPNPLGREGLFTKKTLPGTRDRTAGEMAGRIPPRRQPEPTPASNIVDLPTQPIPPKLALPSRTLPLPSETPPLQTEDEEQDIGLLPASLEAPKTTELPNAEHKTSTHDAELAGAAGFGAEMIAAEAIHDTLPIDQGTGPGANIENDDDALPPAQGQPTTASLPSTPAATGTPREKPIIPPSTQPEPLIIDLLQPKSTARTTKILPPSAIADADTIAQAPPPPMPETPPLRRRNGGKTVAAGAAGIVGGDTLVGPSPDVGTSTKPAAPPRTTPNRGKTPTPATRNAGAGRTRPPAGNIATPQIEPSPPRRSASPLSKPPKRRRAALLAALIIVIALVLCGGGWAVLANRGILPNPMSGLIASSPPPATITITPASQVVTDTFVMQSVTTGNADSAQRQVPTRNLTSTQTDAKPATVTGHHHDDAVAATGNITFLNGSFTNTFTVASGTTFPVGTIKIVTDAPAIVPVNTGQSGQATVPAHAVQTGPAGDIAKLAINTLCCDPGGTIKAENLSAFAGGKDAVDYNFLTQGDVDKVTNDSQNQATLKGKAQNDINGQIKNGEKLFSDPTCTTTGTPDAAVGDQGTAVNSANVTVKMTCGAQVYDSNAVKTIALNGLQQEVNKNSALAGYVRAGDIVIQSIQPLQIQQDPTVTSFSVQASGLWYFPWTDPMKQDLAKKIKGLSKTQAQTILNSYTGVDKTNHPKIDISNGGTTLPTDPTQITITVIAPSGLSAGTPTPISPNAIPASTTTSSTPAPTSSAPTPPITGGGGS